MANQQQMIKAFHELSQLSQDEIDRVFGSVMEKRRKQEAYDKEVQSTIANQEIIDSITEQIHHNGIATISRQVLETRQLSEKDIHRQLMYGKILELKLKKFFNIDNLRDIPDHDFGGDNVDDVDAVFDEWLVPVLIDNQRVIISFTSIMDGACYMFETVEHVNELNQKEQNEAPNIFTNALTPAYSAITQWYSFNDIMSK